MSRKRHLSRGRGTSPPLNGTHSAPKNRSIRLGARAASPGVSVGGVDGGQAGTVGKDTGGEVTIHVRVLYRVVWPSGATIRGRHEVYFSPATAPCPKSV